MIVSDTAKTETLSAAEWSPRRSRTVRAPRLRRRSWAKACEVLREHLERLLRRPGQHGAIAARKDWSLEQLGVSLERGEHGLVVVE